MKNIRKVEIDGHTIDYELFVKNVKNINLRFNGGKLTASCNSFIDPKRVDEFVASKYKWVLRNKKRIIENRNRLYTDNNLPEHIYFLGRRYGIKNIITNKTEVFTDDSFLYIMHKKDAEIESVRLLYKYLNKSFEEICSFYVEHYYKRLNESFEVPFPVIKYRYMKSRWGSCNPNKKIVTFNKYMIHYDERFIEYVVLHEMAHFVKGDHSKRFYDVIRMYMPDYKKYDKIEKLIN